MPRRPRGGLAAWLKDSDTPLFVLDARRVVLFFNRGCERLTGWSAADVVGRACDYASEPDGTQLDALTGALCPPPQVFAGTPVRQPVVIAHRDGSTQPREAAFVLLRSEAPTEAHVLGLWLPADSAAPQVSASPAALHADLAALRGELHRRYELDQVIAHSPAMLRVAAQVQWAGGTTGSVHLLGPPGSGRAFLARVIHQRSADRLRPFVPLDCTALTPLELQRTLQKVFEPDRTADPLPVELRPAAVLLKEVASLPRDVQQRLLERLALPPDAGAPGVRLFSTSTEPLAQAVADDRLIPELFYRLTEITIELPALRDRPEDLPLLVQYLVERRNRTVDRQCAGFVPEALRLLQQYNWPANVRELRMVVEAAQEAAEGPFVQPGDLPFRFRTGLEAQRVAPRRVSQPMDLVAHLREVESAEIRRALAESRGNRARAARMLGLTRPRLYRRMEQLGLLPPSESDTPS